MVGDLSFPENWISKELKYGVRRAEIEWIVDKKLEIISNYIVMQDWKGDL